ncbi:response regulator transcription factor [Pirellulaceae bacterium SH449]
MMSVSGKWYRQLLALLASATDPSVQMNLVDRKKVIATGIAESIQADVWIWTTGRINERVPGDAMITACVDDGFTDETERAEFYRIIIHPELAPAVVKPLYQAVKELTSITRMRLDLICDEQWQTLQVSSLWRSLGFDDFIFSLVPLDRETYSSIGFHRRAGNPRFTRQEADFVDLAFPAIDWIHRFKAAESIPTRVTDLSPRERQVFMLLLKGASRKTIASQLKLSDHTITDYIKEIYKKFEVTSRAELLVQFLS